MKVIINKPMGNEELNLLSAFKAENNIYAVFESGKVGSMGLPIIYISKLNNERLEKITDQNEWQNVKNYLKGIINGTPMEYVNVAPNLSADENYFMPLTLPQASFDIIKNRYSVAPAPTLQTPPVAPAVNDTIPAAPTLDTPNIEPAPVVMPSVEPAPSLEVAPPTPPVAPAPAVDLNMGTVASANVMPEPPVPQNPPQPEEPNIAPVPNDSAPTFSKEKETFLKACENMFDAIISKYEGKLNELEQKERALALKEQEINEKMHNADEHLANAQAREQVANIAHDNAQKVMDLNNFTQPIS